MKPLTKIFVFLISVMLHSCSAEDPIPTSGENSFIARLNGEIYIPKNIVTFPSGTNYGLLAVVRNNSWRLEAKNGANKIIYLYINSVNEPGIYVIKDPGRNFPLLNPADTPTSAIIGNNSFDLLYLTKATDATEYIKITKVEGDSIIVGEFEKITLTDPENPNNKTILTDGKFNINTSTLNQPEP